MDPPLRERLRWRNATGNGVERPPRGRRWPAAAALLARRGAAGLPGRRARARRRRGATTTSCSSRPRRRRCSRRCSCSSSTTASRAGASTRSSSSAPRSSTAAAYAWGTESAYGPLPYVWVTLFAFYFFSRAAPRSSIWRSWPPATRSRSGSRTPPENPLDGWIATVVTLLVTGLFVAVVRDRLAR